MRTKKIKLLASITSLVLVIAVMAVGVWAAASQSVNVTTSVSFTATGVSGTITGTLTGLGGTTQYYNSTNAAAGTALTYNPTTSLANWTLGDTDPLAIDNADGVPSNIVYTFTITNASTTDAIVLAVNDLTVGTNLEVTSVAQDGGAPITGTSGDYTLTNIAASGTTSVVITLAVTDSSISITDQDISFNLSLVSINA